MKRVRQTNTVDEAVQKIIRECPSGITETIALEDSYGRILAETIHAHEPVPGFRRSAMDGYAIASKDSIGSSPERPREFKVIDRVAAGDVPSRPISQGEAVRILTGAMMPQNADAVVMQEKVKYICREDCDWIQIVEEIPFNRHVSDIGEDISVGDMIVSAGTRISDGDMALLATFGYHQLQVRRQPTVGIIATGTELVPVFADVSPGKIRNSNSYMLMAQVKKYGGVPKLLGNIPDDKEKMEQSLRTALKDVDFLITSGGVSVGDFDYMPEVFEELGAQLLFDRVAMRPGKPTTVAEKEGKLIFGLSGNPSACFVGFELFAKPAILSFQGYHRVETSVMKAKLDSNLLNNSPFTTFIRGIAYIEQGVLMVSPLHKNKASMLSSLNQANCFLKLPAGNHSWNIDDEVNVMLFGSLN